MFKIFIDNTDFSTLGTSRSNIFILGGLIIDENNETKLIKLIQNIKEEYAPPRMPIKWNLKDLRSLYSSFNKEEVFSNLLKNSNVWREKLFRESAKLDYKIIISIIENMLPKNQLIKDELTQYCFSNILMRAGMELNSLPDKKIIVLDWPDSSNPKPFNSEYYYAYNHGKSLKQLKYFSGPLKNINFNDCLLFASMNHSVGLQFADLIIGAFKEYLDNEIKNKPSVGKTLIPLIKSKLCGYPDKIMQRGVVLQNRESELNKKINEIIK
ncbi:MAG: DUF3800 domain-containing protein [Patescibacteria group bacterium]